MGLGQYSQEVIRISTRPPDRPLLRGALECTTARNPGFFAQAALREFHVSPNSLEQPSDSHVRVTSLAQAGIRRGHGRLRRKRLGMMPRESSHLRKAVLSVKLSDSTEPSMDVLTNPPTVILKFHELQGTPALPSRLHADAAVP
jgi:hypothetical protein